MVGPCTSDRVKRTNGLHIPVSESYQEWRELQNRLLRVVKIILASVTVYEKELFLGRVDRETDHVGGLAVVDDLDDGQYSERNRGVIPA